jgi:RluA family pseudouridine synthase
MEGDRFVTVATRRMGVRAYLKHEVGFPASTLAAIPDSDILLDGAPLPPRHRLGEGEEISVLIGEAPQKESRPLPFPILWEDAHLLAVAKPHGIATHPSLGHYHDSLATAVSAYLGGRTVRPVNRLDRDTSGAVLFAKHRLMAALLSEEWKQGRVEKTYLALTETPPSPPEGEIALPIGRKEGSIMEREVREDGDSAVTEYRALPSGLLLVSPKTGRTHQIRVHMAALGCPLLGDTLYGSPSPLIGRQALHALRLSFTHPMTGEMLSLSCPLPDDMERARRLLYPTRNLEES